MSKYAEDLQQEIDTVRENLKADGYSLTIGQLSSMYRDGELALSPHRQGAYEWNMEQKSRQIENLLIGFPAPSITVVQTADRWEIIDGDQWLKAVLQFQGLVEGARSFRLHSLRFLPSAEDIAWNEEVFVKKPEKTLTTTQRRMFNSRSVYVSIVMFNDQEMQEYYM